MLNYALRRILYLVPVLFGVSVISFSLLRFIPGDPAIVLAGVGATQADLEAQFALRIKIRDKLSETHDTINMLRNIRRQVESWERLTEEREDHEVIVRLGEIGRASCRERV